MDPLSSLALTVVAIGVLTYSVYGAVRKGVRDGLRDDRARLQKEDEASRQGRIQ